MTDKEYKEEKQRVRKLWDKWFDTLGLRWFMVYIVWNRALNEHEPSEIACTSTNWQYRTAAVTFNLPLCAEQDNDKLERTIVHEMAHILCGPLQDFRDDSMREITEYTVTTVSRAILWARMAGKKDKKEDIKSSN